MLALLVIQTELQVCSISFGMFFLFTLQLQFDQFLSLSENSDITVVCGTEHMDLSIYICPVYQALYNESLMVLNNQLNKPECFGTPDWTVNPPVLRFSFPINGSSTSVCENNFKVCNTIDIKTMS